MLMKEYTENDPELLAWQIKAIEAGIASADRGELIPHAEMLHWLEKWSVGSFERIYITGAAGSGTTTLGAEIARSINAVHIDIDDFYWEVTDPPYATKKTYP